MNNKLIFSPSNLKSNTSFGSERRSWIIEIHNFLEQEEEQEEEQDVAVCIFNVPKPLKSSNPDAFVPQMLALGPYHHFHDHLHEMERYKLVVTKKVQAKFPNLKFQDLTNKMTKYESKIRACYHKYLEIDSETLAMMMVFDGLFLLEFLNIYVDMSSSILASSTKMCHLVNKTGKRYSYDSILRDAFMLENQIPLLVLKKLLHFEYSTLPSNLSNQSHEPLLPMMLLGISKEISPFKLSDILMPAFLLQLSSCAHLLDALYHLIVPKNNELSQDDYVDETMENDNKEGRDQTDDKNNPDPDEDNTKEVFEGVWNFLSSRNLRVISKVCKPLKFLVHLPWKFMQKLPGVSMVLSTVMSLLFHNDEKSNSKDGKIQQNTLADEIVIPNVTSLYKAGIKFCASEGGITSIMFDTKANILYLPIISLDVNSQVILRNLVAYEATMISGPSVLARYMEFMNGIIDTAADAKLLREKNIIINHMRSDKQVAEFWNGMSRSIRVTKVPILDTIIVDINGYYHKTWKVKTHKVIKRFLHGSWEILVVLVTILFLCLMGLQAFCSAYNCPRVFHTDKALE